MTIDSLLSIIPPEAGRRNLPSNAGVSISVGPNPLPFCLIGLALLLGTGVLTTIYITAMKTNFSHI